ncbi:MAG TPA: nicotinate phosphoribosyltransferase, partial [Oscillospiraceae bacterium]|nr:nicotinate phosphoribosyltransferase [Oscillospiraceae bacterium]
YNVLKTGVPNAIKVFDDVLKPMGVRPKGIRIDSGDIAFLSKQARKMLDDAGYPDCGIVASNSLDEYLISDLIHQGACVNSFGVGENLITAKSDPVFGGVYKLAAVERGGVLEPAIKISESVGKITNPGFKTFYRLYDKDTGKANADYICLRDEPAPDTSAPFEIFDPNATWKRKRLENVEVKEMLMPIFRHGEQVYACPPLREVQKYCAAQLDTLWEELRRLEYPHKYYVDLSQKLWSLKDSMLHRAEHGAV